MEGDRDSYFSIESYSKFVLVVSAKYVEITYARTTILAGRCFTWHNYLK